VHEVLFLADLAPEVRVQFHRVPVARRAQVALALVLVPLELVDPPVLVDRPPLVDAPLVVPVVQLVDHVDHNVKRLRAVVAM
jgi:hypothetical protein